MHYFAALLMTNRQSYSILSKISALCMIISLVWLTVSAPFVFAAQQELAKLNKTERAAMPIQGNEEESPFGNSTEEKAPSSTSFSEEYLHDHHLDHHFLLIGLRYHKNFDAGTYIAFHGELLVPPPNQA
jgi:hypothetical protein